MKNSRKVNSKGLIDKISIPGKDWRIARAKFALHLMITDGYLKSIIDGKVPGPVLRHNIAESLEVKEEWAFPFKK